MFRNCQFHCKIFNRLPFSFYCSIYILFIKCFFCKAYDDVYSSNFGNGEAVSINSEEITRRQNIANSYLKQSDNGEKDWIETYHESFSGSSVFPLRKTTQQNSPESEYGIHAKFLFQNEDLPSLKNYDTDHPEGFLFNGENCDKNPKKETLKSFKKINDQILPESFKTDKNDKVNQNSINSENNEKSNSRFPAKISESSKIVRKYPKKSHSKSRLKTDKLKKISESCEITNDTESYSNVKYFNFIKNDLAIANENKNLSVNENKLIQIMLKNSEFISEKYFICGETLTLTEFSKLQKNLASLSFLQSKNNVYSINRMNIIDSIGKVTPLLKQDEFYKGKPKKFCSDNDITTETFCYKDNNIMKSKTDLEKHVGHRIDSNEIIIPKKSNLLHSINKEENMLFSSLERFERKDFSCDSKICRRKQMINTFIATLNNNQENWIETYHLNDLKNKPERKGAYNLQKIAEQNSKFPKAYSQERLYIIRWINKLQNKLKDSDRGYYSLSVLISADLNKILRDLSQEFDIIMFDELVNNMISNATLYNNYANTFFFDHEYISNAIFLLQSTKMYIFITFLFFSIILYNLSKTRPANFSFHRGIFAFIIHFKWILLITLLIFSLSWNGYKMYQQKIAEKHLVISRVVPSYCESILVEESGVLAHFKEYFRHWYHDDACRKYYDAVMVDPSSEINPFSISSDLLADIIFQMLQPFARNMNTFFKTLTSNLSYIQEFIIIIVVLFALIIILIYSLSFSAFRCNYKVNFPFHLGSIEPTEFSKGSGVEEVEEKNSLTDFSTSCDGSLVNYNNETKNKNFTEDNVLKENILKIDLEHFKSEQSKHYVLKPLRTRHNSI